MTDTLLLYRVRIRNASTLADPNGTADDLVLTSQRGGTNPYIVDAPSGDGQEVDPLTGDVRTGSYRVLVADAITSGTDRVFTAKLFDSSGRQKMLSRRVYIEISDDDGASWDGLLAGYLLNYRLIDAITWELMVGDTRRIEQNRVVFDGSSTSFAQHGCIFGGPIIGGSWGPITTRGGWQFRVATIIPLSVGNQVYFTLERGFRSINDPLTSRIQDLVMQNGSSPYSNKISDRVQGYFSPLVAPFAAMGFPGLVAFIEEYAGESNGGNFTPGALDSQAAQGFIHSGGFPADHFSVLWPADITTPSVGDVVHITCYATLPSEVSPTYLTEHPVDVATTLFMDNGIPYDAASAAAVRTALGDTLRVSMRITEPWKLRQFLVDCLFGPFGFSTRTDGDGNQVFFTTRLKQSDVPSVTFDTDTFQHADDVLFENDEDSVITTVRYRSRVFWAYDPTKTTDDIQRPLDGVFATVLETVINNSDTAAYGDKEIVYDLPGLIHDENGIAQDMDAFTAAIGHEVFDRYGRGSPVGEFSILRGLDGDVQIGDEVYLEPSHLPNLNKRFGDDPSVGARIVQILRRTETPAGPRFKYIDAGSDEQPVTPAAVITIAQNAFRPSVAAEFTITNAAAINAAAVLTTAVQWATGASAPSDGVPFIRYAPGDVPTTAVLLPPCRPATKVWVRARTEQDGRRPSAWTAWTSATLDDVTTPTGLTFTDIFRYSAVFNWDPVAELATDVYVFKGTVAPSDWEPYRVATVQPDSPSIEVRHLEGPASILDPPIDYIGAIQHRDLTTGERGPMLTDTFQTIFILKLGATMRGIQVVPSSSDASQPTGVLLALYPVEPGSDIDIYRGTTDVFADADLLVTIRGGAETYMDPLPIDGTSYYYWARASIGSLIGSDLAGPVLATAGAAPIVTPRPVAFQSDIRVGTSFSGLQEAIDNVMNAEGAVELGAQQTVEIFADIDLPVGVTLRSPRGSPGAKILGDGTFLINSTGGEEAMRRTGRFENLLFDGVGILFGKTSDDWAQGSTVRGCQFKNFVAGADPAVTAPVTYRYNSFNTVLDDLAIHDCADGVLFDYSGIGSGSGARQVMSKLAIFNVERGIVVDGNASDGHDYKITDSDIEHTTVAGIYYHPGGDGAMFLQNVHMELNSGAYIDQAGGNLFCDGIWAFPLDTDHDVFARITAVDDEDARLFLMKGRLQWEPEKLVELLHEKARLIIDADQIVPSAAFFGWNSQPLATAGTTAGQILNGGPGIPGLYFGAKMLCAQNNEEYGVMGPGTGSAINIGQIQAFDAAPRVYEFDFIVSTVAGCTDNRLVVLLNPGGTIGCVLVLPLIEGGGHVKVCYTPNGLFQAFAHYNGTFVYQAAVDTNGHTVQRFITIYSDNNGGTGTTMDIHNLYEIVN